MTRLCNHCCKGNTTMNSVCYLDTYHRQQYNLLRAAQQCFYGKFMSPETIKPTFRFPNKVPDIFVRFYQIRIFSKDFRGSSPNTKFHANPSSMNRVQACWTDRRNARHDVTLAIFAIYAQAHKTPLQTSLYRNKQTLTSFSASFLALRCLNTGFVDITGHSNQFYRRGYPVHQATQNYSTTAYTAGHESLLRIGGGGIPHVPYSLIISLNCHT